MLSIFIFILSLISIFYFYISYCNKNFNSNFKYDIKLIPVLEDINNNIFYDYNFSYKNNFINYNLILFNHTNKFFNLDYYKKDSNIDHNSIQDNLLTYNYFYNINWVEDKLRLNYTNLNYFNDQELLSEAYYNIYRFDTVDQASLEINSNKISYYLIEFYNVLNIYQSNVNNYKLINNFTFKHNIDTEKIIFINDLYDFIISDYKERIESIINTNNYDFSASSLYNEYKFKERYSVYNSYQQMSLFKKQNSPLVLLNNSIDIFNTKKNYFIYKNFKILSNINYKIEGIDIINLNLKNIESYLNVYNNKYLGLSFFNMKTLKDHTKMNYESKPINRYANINSLQQIQNDFNTYFGSFLWFEDRNINLKESIEYKRKDSIQNQLGMLELTQENSQGEGEYLLDNMRRNFFSMSADETFNFNQTDYSYLLQMENSLSWLDRFYNDPDLFTDLSIYKKQQNFNISAESVLSFILEQKLNKNSVLNIKSFNYNITKLNHLLNNIKFFISNHITLSNNFKLNFEFDLINSSKNNYYKELNFLNLLSTFYSKYIASYKFIYYKINKKIERTYRSNIFSFALKYDAQNTINQYKLLLNLVPKISFNSINQNILHKYSDYSDINPYYEEDSDLNLSTLNKYYINKLELNLLHNKFLRYSNITTSNKYILNTPLLKNILINYLEYFKFENIETFFELNNFIIKNKKFNGLHIDLLNTFIISYYHWLVREFKNDNFKKFLFPNFINCNLKIDRNIQDINSFNKLNVNLSKTNIFNTKLLELKNNFYDVFFDISLDLSLYNTITTKLNPMNTPIGLFINNEDNYSNVIETNEDIINFSTTNNSTYEIDEYSDIILEDDLPFSNNNLCDIIKSLFNLSHIDNKKINFIASTNFNLDFFKFLFIIKLNYFNNITKLSYKLDDNKYNFYHIKYNLLLNHHEFINILHNDLINYTYPELTIRNFYINSCIDYQLYKKNINLSYFIPTNIAFYLTNIIKELKFVRLLGKDFLLMCYFYLFYLFYLP